MKDLDFNKKLLNLMENAFPMGMASPEEESENVSYSKTKSKGDARVTISANAKSMQELHDVLKLAGITLPKNDDHEDHEDHDHEEPEMDREEGEPCPQCGEVDCDCPPGECDCEPADDEGGEANMIAIKNPSYSTDKDVLMGMLKDKLAKHLS